MVEFGYKKLDARAFEKRTAQKTTGGIAPIRKILLLTDGHLNTGITEPDRVEALTRAGMENDEIRTSCLGFGDGYNENILAAMSKVGQGNYTMPIQPRNSLLSSRMNSMGCRK